MFSPCDAILCFYILLGEKYIVNNNYQGNAPPSWYENKVLITNDNIFDINDIIQIEDEDN
jgi:hypothetical protein